MAEVRDKARFCEEHGLSKTLKCFECHDEQKYCEKCYIKHTSIKHGVHLPILIWDEAQKRVLLTEKYIEGDNEGKMRLKEFEKRASEVKQELDGPLKESRVMIEKKVSEITRMMCEAEKCDAEARKCAEQLNAKVVEAELRYNREMERVKTELQAIKRMKDGNEADDNSIRVENEAKATLWLDSDTIRGVITKCEEATGKLKCAYRDLQMKVLTREKDTIMMGKVIQTVSRLMNERLEECKNKIERRLKESEEAVIKSVSNVIKRYRDERAKFNHERKNPSGIVRQLEESSAARVKDLEGQLGEKKNELEQGKQREKKENEVRLDEEKKLASKMDDLKRLQQDNEWLKDNAMKANKEDLQKFQDMLREKIVEDERYADAPKMASSIYTHYYSYDGGKVMHLYNTVTKKPSTLTFDNDHPEKYSSTIIVGNNLYIIGGEGPSSAVYSLAIVDGATECKASKKKELRVARNRLGLAQYAGKHIYALGGWDNEKPVKCCEKYDIENDSWDTLKDLKEVRQFPTVCVIKGFIYAIAGYGDKVNLSSIERMSIFKEDEGWEDLAIDNTDKGWTARYGCGVCKINEDTVIVFGGCCDNTSKAECYLMKAVNNAAVIRKLTNSLAMADNVCRLANGVIRNDELYSLSANNYLHVCDLRSNKWEVQAKLFD